MASSFGLSKFPATIHSPCGRYKRDYRKRGCTRSPAHRTRAHKAAEPSIKPEPGTSVHTNGGLYYTVKEGDSISSVSRQFSVPVGTLTSINRARGVDFTGADVVPGTVLKIIERRQDPSTVPSQAPAPDMSIVAKDVEVEQLKMLHNSPGGVGANIGTDLVLLVYAPWCQYSTAMMDEYNALARGLAHDPSVVVAKLRGDLDRVFCLELGVTSYPTVLAFPRTGGQPFVYGTQNRSAEYILRFANLACRAAPNAEQMKLEGQYRGEAPMSQVSRGAQGTHCGGRRNTYGGSGSGGVPSATGAEVARGEGGTAA